MLPLAIRENGAHLRLMKGNNAKLEYYKRFSYTRFKLINYSLIRTQEKRLDICTGYLGSRTR